VIFLTGIIKLYAKDFTNESTRNSWYNRVLALDYMEKYAEKSNTQYADFTSLGGDCTNFVSQVLMAGGMSMQGKYNPGEHLHGITMAHHPQNAHIHGRVHKNFHIIGLIMILRDLKGPINAGYIQLLHSWQILKQYVKVLVGEM
jgi:hypothetical protein